MAKYKISRLNGGKLDGVVHFNTNNKVCKVEFDETGTAYTSDADIADFFRNRNFANTFPNGGNYLYTVQTIEE